MDLGRGLRNALAKVTGAAIVDEKAVKELVRELQRVLISNDVNIKLVFQMSKNIEKKALDKDAIRGISTREHVVKVVYDELVSLMGEKHEPRLGKHRIMLLGLYGSGKTTTCGKLAHFYKKRGLSAALICCDVDRPAAYEQLEQTARKVGAPFYGIKDEKDVRKIMRMAMAAANEDVLILDSSGRSAFDEGMMDELKTLNQDFKPDEKLLVINADIGQVAGRQATEFNKGIGLTGVIITKFDGSGKGGGALSAIAASDARATFIGTGEKLDDFEVYDAKKVVGRLLGFPDLEALIEKVKAVSEEQKLPDELPEKFTLKVFYDQLKAARKMGPLSSVFSMIGAADMPKDMVQQSEEKLKKFESIINSMAPAEREDAHLLRKSKSRIERIAKGAGVKPEDVRDLLSQFEKVEGMMKSLKGNRGLKRKLEKMMKGGKLPEGFA